MAERVPTAEDLIRMGPEYAVGVDWVAGKRKSDPMRPSKVRITPKGHALMGEGLRRNGMEARARGVGDWHDSPPHSRVRPNPDLTPEPGAP